MLISPNSPLASRPTSSSGSRAGAHNPVPTINIKHTAPSTSASPASNSGYVATLREQQATVWCKSAQAAAPSILHSPRTSTSRTIKTFAGSVSFRSLGNDTFARDSGSSVKWSREGYRSVAKTQKYDGRQMCRDGMPVRLSACEMDRAVVDENMDAERQQCHDLGLAPGSLDVPTEPRQQQLRHSHSQTSLTSLKEGSSTSALPISCRPVVSMGNLKVCSRGYACR